MAKYVEMSASVCAKSEGVLTDKKKGAELIERLFEKADKQKVHSGGTVDDCGHTDADSRRERDS